MLRAYTNQLAPARRLRLLIKYLMYPGSNWVNRDKARIARMFLQGTPDHPVQTLDCGCGNAYFSHRAIQRGSKCLGITIHPWEKHNCEEMRTFLGWDESQLELRVTNLEKLAGDASLQGRFDQVLLLDVIEHILDAGAALRQIHTLMAEDGLIYITTPDRDWQGNAGQIRVSRTEDGWHVRNGYTMEQLEALLEQNGFEPVDRLRLGTVGSTVVMWIQHHLFRSWIDPLTVLTYPLLKLLAVALSPWRDRHTIFVLARKRRAG